MIQFMGRHFVAARPTCSSCRRCWFSRALLIEVEPRVGLLGPQVARALRVSVGSGSVRCSQSRHLLPTSPSDSVYEFGLQSNGTGHVVLPLLA